MSRWFRVAALASVAFVLVVLGAALRPLVLPEQHTTAPVLNAVEIGFAQDMTAHHQQALIMVQRLDRDVDPTVRRLAQQLSDAQRIEIGTMLGWLRLADASPLSPHPMAWLHADAAVSHHHPSANQSTGDAMPGMATIAELDALSAAHGHNAEILFLQLMFRHHQGGLVMARAADELLTSGPIKETARSMFQSQSQEAGVISVLLTQLGGQAAQ
ncbi:DUF305 domain-containing protein [Nocardia vinacea]|uniref:DUF305 domain-containing protein n=1 Tax=Nocardia vinacea TaxID=96468 RepID=UPI000307FD94|nr:DUF305 domain-containing protein [Nocardia vinacea]